jgi:hypothetical protein
MNRSPSRLDHDRYLSTTQLASAAGDLEVDSVADRAAKAVKLCLDAWLLLGDDEQGRRAMELLALLYPKGLQLTQASFAVQNAEIHRMLTEMKTPDVAAALDELVGSWRRSTTSARGWDRAVVAVVALLETKPSPRTATGTTRMKARQCERALGMDPWGQRMGSRRRRHIAGVH